MTASPTAAVPGDVGLPSEEDERALNLAARAMQREMQSRGTEEHIEEVIWRYLGPAFKAKEREIEWLRGFVSSSEAERYRKCAELSDRALSAEAKLAQAVEELSGLRQAIVDAAVICDDDGKAGDRLDRLARAIRARSASGGETE